MIQTPVSYGELLDKWTILTIKRERIQDPDKLRNIGIEHDALTTVIVAEIDTDLVKDEIQELKKVNEELWEIEDTLRLMEADGIWRLACKELLHSTDPPNEGDSQVIIEFIRVARSVYFTNDRRCAIKRAINEKLGSGIVEEKGYVDYQNGSGSGSE